MNTMGKAISIAAITAATAVPLRGSNLHGVYVYPPRCAEIGSTSLNRCSDNLSIDKASVNGKYLSIRLRDRDKAKYKFSAYDGNKRMELMRGRKGELVISGVRNGMVVTLTATRRNEEEDFSMFITK